MPEKNIITKPDQAHFQDVLGIYNEEKSAYRERDENIISQYEIIGGNMYTAEDREALIAQKRSINEYNLLEGRLNAVIGTISQLRQNMRAVARKNRSLPVSNLMTSAMYHNYSKSWYDWVKSDQSVHCAIGGVAFGYLYWNFVLGHLEYRALDALRIRWDRSTKDPLFRDCRWLQDTQFLSKEEIVNLCQDPETRKEFIYQIKHYEPQKFQNTWYEKKAYGTWGDYTPKTGDDDFVDYRLGRYRVVDHHENRDYTSIYLISSEQMKQVDATDWAEEQIKSFLNENLSFTRIDVTETKKHQTMICPITQMVIRDEPYPINTLFFNYIPQVAYNTKPYIFQAQGILENPAKINQGINARLNVITDYGLEVIGGGFKSEQGAITGHEDDWDTRDRKYLRIYNDGYSAPERLAPGQVPATMFQVVGEEISLFDVATAIGKNYMGMRESANETGVLASTKIKQTENVLQRFLNNATRSQYMDAYMAVEHIKKYMTEEQAIKLLDTSESVVVNQQTIDGVVNSLTEDIEYEIEIDETRPSATARQSAFLKDLSMAQMFPQFTRVDKLWEMSDSPMAKEQAEFARAIYKAQGIDINNLEGADPQALVNLAMQNQNQGGTPNLSLLTG